MGSRTRSDVSTPAAGGCPTAEPNQSIRCGAASRTLPAEVFDGSSVEDVVAAFQGRQLLGAHRKGKQMWLTLQGEGPNPLIHLGELLHVGQQCFG